MAGARGPGCPAFRFARIMSAAEISSHGQGLKPGTPARWSHKDLTGIQALTAEELTVLLDTAAAFKSVGTRHIKKVPALRGKTLVNFFVEPSTRTRISFELAA